MIDRQKHELLMCGQGGRGLLNRYYGQELERKKSKIWIGSTYEVEVVESLA